MAKTHIREYKDFRFKVLLTVILVVLSTLIFQNTLLLYPPFAMLALPNFMTVFMQMLLTLLIIALPVIGALGAVIVRTLQPLHAAVSAISRNKELDEQKYYAARRSVSKLWKNVVIANIIAYSAAWLVGVVFDIGSVISIQGLLQLLFVLSIAAFAAMLQYSIITIIIARPRAMLKIYSIDEKRDVRSMDVTRKSVQQTQIIASFLVMTMAFGFLQIYNIEHRFQNLMTSVATDEISLQEAEDGYYTELSQIPGFNITRSEFSITDHQPEISRFTVILFLYIVFLVIIAGGAYYLGSKSMLGQLMLIRRKLKELVQGDVELTRKIEIIEFDEVGDIVAYLNAFMDQMRELLETMVNASRQAADSSESLQAVIHRTSTAAERMVSAVNQVSSSADEQMESVETTGADIRGILSSLETISDQVNTQASFVEQTSSSVNEMAASIDSVTQAAQKTNTVSEELTKVARDGSDAVKKSITAIREIEAGSQQINDIVTVISKISAQTNLLAMNAAIEAAHAGDAGRGFAVVAEEVRNLAENSSKSAKGITSQIKSMLERIENGVALSENAGVSLDRISQDIEQTNQLVAEISLAMKEQNAGTTEILQSITSLVESTQTISEVVNTQRERSEAMKQSVTELIQAFSEIQSATHQQASDNTEIASSVEHMQQVASENEKVVGRLKSVLERYSLQFEREI
ncbi:MAG: methyl-accepting chemotaxis protein [Spirochaeta sp.]